MLCLFLAGLEAGGRGVALAEVLCGEEEEEGGVAFSPQGNQDEKENTDLANTKEKTPMCLVNELARYNKVSRSNSQNSIQKYFILR